MLPASKLNTLCPATARAPAGTADAAPPGATFGSTGAAGVCMGSDASTGAAPQSTGDVAAVPAAAADGPSAGVNMPPTGQGRLATAHASSGRDAPIDTVILTTAHLQVGVEACQDASADGMDFEPVAMAAAAETATTSTLEQQQQQQGAPRSAVEGMAPVSSLGFAAAQNQEDPSCRAGAPLSVLLPAATSAASVSACSPSHAMAHSDDASTWAYEDAFNNRHGARVILECLREVSALCPPMEELLASGILAMVKAAAKHPHVAVSGLAKQVCMLQQYSFCTPFCR